MKKIIALICILAVFSACIIPVNAVSMTPNEDVAKEHGYSILYSLIDGWETPRLYVDKNDNIPNQIIIETNEKLDVSQYVYGEVNDFYGIEVFYVNYLFDTLVDKVGPLEEHGIYMYMYVLTTVDFLTDEELEAWDSEYDFITDAYFDRIIYIAEDVEPEPEVEYDVNMDGSFDTMDYVLIKRVYFGTYPEKKLNCTRGDLNNNREIDSMDYTLLKRAYFGTYRIK